MNYDKFFINALDVLKEEGRYRVFNDIKRISGKFPNAVYFSGDQEKKVVVWCSNDYLGMGQNKYVIEEKEGFLEASNSKKSKKIIFFNLGKNNNWKKILSSTCLV